VNAYDEETTIKRRKRFVVEAPLHQAGPGQMALDFNPPPPPAELTIEARFLAFHAANPHVYRALRRLALDHAAQGATRISTKLLFEQLRAEGITTAGGEEFGLNNIFTSRFARMLACEPELYGKIPMRMLQAE
jgi:hypothetical protein